MKVNILLKDGTKLDECSVFEAALQGARALHSFEAINNALQKDPWGRKLVYVKYGGLFGHFDVSELESYEILVGSRQRASTHLVLKWDEIHTILSAGQIRTLEGILESIQNYNDAVGKPTKRRYLIVNHDEPYAQEVADVISKHVGEEIKING